MGFLEFITVILIILKATGVIAISWIIVFSPMILALVFYAVWFIFVGNIFKNTLKQFKK